MKQKNEFTILISKLDTQGDIQAERIIQKIKKVGDEIIPYLIVSAQNEESPRIMKWSLLALGTIGAKKGIPILVKALEHERMTVKLQALGALARMKHKPAARKIIPLLNDESGGVRGRALTTLIVLNNKSIVNSIPPMLNDPMWYVRLEACKACEHFKIKSAIPLLMMLENSDEKKAVRMAALRALKK